MKGSLEEPLAKLRRAKDHLVVLKGVLPNPGVGIMRPVTFEAQADGREYRLHVGTLPPLDTDGIALLLGDFLFDLRASLDHLVYQLHVRRYRGNVPVAVARHSAFPLRLNPSKDWREIAAVSLKHQATIKHLQPYVGRNDGWRDTRYALGLLAVLHNIDKHRRLHVARRMPYAFPFPNFPSDCGFRDTPFFGALEDHAEVGRWSFAHYVPDNVAEQMEMNGYIVENVFLDEPEADAFGAMPLMTLVRILWERTKRVLRHFERDFPPVDFPALPL